MSRELEQFTSSESTHYVGRSFNNVMTMIDGNEWEKLFNFWYNSWLEIVKELYTETGIDNEFMLADAPLFLEHGVVNGVLSYPEYYEIMSLTKISQKRNLLPTFTKNYDYYKLSKVIEDKYDYHNDKTVL